LSERESGRGRSGEGAHESADEEASAEDQAAAHRLLAARHRRWVQRKANRASAGGSASIPESGGNPLAPAVRNRMEGHLGADLSAVKVHTGGESATAAEQLGARAFATGTDIHFGAGEFAPGTKEGDRLLAHELAHTVQAQKSGVQRKADPTEHGGSDGEHTHEVSEPGDPAEKEADAVGDRAAEGLHGHDSDSGNEHGHAAAKPAIESKPAPVGRKIYRKAAPAKGAPAVGAPAAGAPTTAPATPPKAGATGILKAESTVQLGGKDVKLPAGTVVEVVSAGGDKLKVKVHSGHGGAQADIPTTAFQAQPGVAINDETKKPRGDNYEDFSGATLWGDEGPKAEDAAQGAIGDCYLIAAMGAICARNPSAITNAFNPKTSHASSYTVTLHTKDPVTGKLKAEQVAVDSQLPAFNKQAPEPGEGAPQPAGAAKADPKLAYAGMGKTAKTAKLWPSLMEKAYAKMVGGYGEAGKGGQAAAAMEAITGVESDNDKKPDKDQVLDRFRKYMKEGKAVVCGSLGSMEHNQEHAFKVDGGEYKATLTTKDGESASVLPGTVEIRDDKSKKKLSAADDANGKIVGPDVESGSIAYSGGKTAVKFKKDSQPDAPENLKAAFDFRGRISKALKIYAHHAYVFEKVDGEMLIFRNPWGFEHPEPIDAESFTKFFSSVSTNQVPKPGEKPPGG
jgi:hypothetical protein